MLVGGVLVIAGCTAIGCNQQRNPPVAASASRSGPPNIILVIADDLGYGELGCYGQKIIKTPNIDALAARGMRFTDGYSGSCVCAPSRCSMLTGFHTGHSAIRDNKELAPTGQEPLPAASVTIAQLLKQRGYATAAIGKWGLGPPGSSGDPSAHGFDLFFGYFCHRHAHNHYPSHLYRNAERIELAGNRDEWDSGVALGGTYAPDLFREEAEKFIADNRSRPFFLLFATPVPHAALQAPEDSIAEYRGVIEDSPYDGTNGYLKHPTPHAAYAAMVTRMDRDFGRIISRVRELGLERDTLVIFTSDNGPTFNGGTDSVFFRSTAGLRGTKGQLYEGGIRVPLIISWPGRIRAGAVSRVVTGNWDLLPTLGRVAGVDAARMPPKIDGIDLSPELFSTGTPTSREHLYWEYAAGEGLQAVRLGDFKAVRHDARKNPDGPIELYDLSADSSETTNIASQHPQVVARAREIMSVRTPSTLPEWNFGP